MKILCLIFTLLTTIISISCSSPSVKPTVSRTISSVPDCLETTRNLIKENVKLIKKSRYWVAASIICSNPEKYDLDKIFSFHKDLNDENYYHGGSLNTGISYYPPLVIAINLNGDKSKLTCLAEKKDDFDKSSIRELREAPRASKYLMASRLCSNI